jgi:NodT family efflux transporter outer membrane factor (OMF) lipoprotein
MSAKKVIPSVIALVIVAACAAPKPAPTTAEIVAEALPSTTNISAGWAAAMSKGVVEDGWLQSFEDPRLEALAAEVLRNSPVLRAAAANVESAAAAARQAGANLAPVVSIGGGAGTSQRGSIDTQTSGVALNVGWELDVWGRLSAAAAAAEASYQAIESDFEYGRQSLIAQTAKAWFLATDARQQKMLAQEAVDIYTQLLEIATVREKVGRASAQDVYLARADQSSAEEKLRFAQGAFEQALRSIELMLGRYPSAELEASEDFVPVPPAIPVGVPSALLERRPDIVAAERRVAAAFQRTESAKAAKLPQIGLSLSGGRSSSELVGLIGADQNFWSAAANFVAPIDIGGGLQAQVEISTAEQEAAVAGYGQAALRAFGEVEQALSNESLMAEREDFLSSVVQDNTRAYEASKTQYDVGKIDMLSLLQMQARVLGSRAALVHIRNARLAQRVDLHLALGGSFE